jgi:DNA recombination protein RmuC
MNLMIKVPLWQLGIWAALMILAFSAGFYALMRAIKQRDALKSGSAGRENQVREAQREVNLLRTELTSYRDRVQSETEKRVAAEGKMTRVTQLEEDLARASAQASSLMTNVTELRERVGRTEAEAKIAREQLTATQSELNTTRQRRDALDSEVGNLRTKVAELRRELDLERQQTTSRLDFLQNTRDELTAQFKTIADSILEEKTKRVSDTQEDSLAELLEPLKDRLREFENKVSDTYSREARERHALQGEIKRLTDMHNAMSRQTESFTRALRNNAGGHGTWGEVVLESILSDSGLRKGIEYTVPPSDHIDGDVIQPQPDVIINLPEQKQVVIDAKISLTAYERYSSSDTESERNEALRVHIEGVRNHVRMLAKCDYQSLYDASAVDFTFMFIPIEAAFTQAISQDRELYNWALKKNVVMVSPTTLLVILRVIANIWHYERQNRNAVEIARVCGQLYDKFVSFVGDLDEVGRRIESTRKSYDDAYGKLKFEKGNLIRTAERVRELGVKPQKTLALVDFETDSGAGYAEIGVSTEDVTGKA